MSSPVDSRPSRGVESGGGVGGMWFKQHWRTISGVPSLLPSLGKGVLWCLDQVGRADVVISHLDGAGWLWTIANWIFNPPGWLLLPLTSFGLGMIWWDVRLQKVSQIQENPSAVSSQNIPISSETPLRSHPSRSRLWVAVGAVILVAGALYWVVPTKPHAPVQQDITLQNFFATEFAESFLGLATHEVTVGDASVPIYYAAHVDPGSGGAFLKWYIPRMLNSLDVAAAIAAELPTITGRFPQMTHLTTTGELRSTNDAPEIKRVLIYHDDLWSNRQMERLL